jgi:hypothetical protein
VNIHLYAHESFQTEQPEEAVPAFPSGKTRLDEPALFQWNVVSLHECCVTNGYTDNAEKAFHGNHWNLWLFSNDFYFPDPLLLIDWRK